MFEPIYLVELTHSPILLITSGFLLLCPSSLSSEYIEPLHQTHDRTLDTAAPNDAGHAESSHQRVISFLDDEHQVEKSQREGGNLHQDQRETVEEEFQDLLELAFKFLDPKGNRGRRRKRGDWDFGGMCWFRAGKRRKVAEGQRGVWPCRALRETGGAGKGIGFLSINRLHFCNS